MLIMRVLVVAGLFLLPVVVSLSAEQRPGAPAAPSAAPAGSSTAGLGGDAEHGRYIVERVAMCIECHSGRDAQGNIIEALRFMGGPMPVSRASWAGDWPNAIPRIAGLPGYTDALAIRLLTQGAIKRDGTQLRAPMPRFRMTPQDAADVVAYLRLF